MTPARNLLCAVGLVAALAGCSKPTEEACDKAVVNIRTLTGQGQSEVGADRRSAVRSCRAQSNRDTVECYAEAQTREELLACGGEMAAALEKAEKKAGSGSSGSSSSGSGASGAGASGAGAESSGEGAESGAGSGSESGSGW